MPRRFAPRNDMQKLAACLRGQGRNDRPKPAPVYACKYVLPGETCSRLQIRLGARLCIRAHLPTFCMSLRASALKWRGNPSSPQRDFASWYYLGQIRRWVRIRLKYCSFLRPAAGVTDCHVASLLAMTCRNLQRACVGKGAMTGRNLQRVCVGKGAMTGQNLRRSTLASMSCRGKLAAAYKFAWEHVFVSAHTCPPSACHCEPVLGGPAKGRPLRGEEP